MSKKKILLTVLIVIVAVASVFGVTYAAWVEFTSKPTGNWVVESNIPKDITIISTVGGNEVYQGHNGSADEKFVSTATVTLKSTKDMTIKGVADVICKKDNGEVVAIDADKIFVVVFINGEGVESPTFSLTANTEIVLKIGVIFPDLSDYKYQKTTFTIKVNISENVANA